MSVDFGNSLTRDQVDGPGDDPAQARSQLDAIIARLNDKLVNKTLLDSTDILDEDDFASDSAEDAPSQQSTKVYVDARSKVVGEVFAISTDITGASEPDNSGDSGAKFIKLTAGETGTGEYNEGLLTSESVSGSSPTITATAVISHADSPMDGQTVRLINTEERFLRAGNAGVTQGSQFGSHNHGGGNHSHTVRRWSSSSGTTDSISKAQQGTSLGTENLSPSTSNSGSIINTSGGSETRPRNVGITYYMRIA